MLFHLFPSYNRQGSPFVQLEGHFLWAWKVWSTISSYLILQENIHWKAVRSWTQTLSYARTRPNPNWSSLYLHKSVQRAEWLSHIYWDHKPFARTRPNPKMENKTHATMQGSWQDCWKRFIRSCIQILAYDYVKQDPIPRLALGEIVITLEPLGQFVWNFPRGKNATYSKGSQGFMHF